MARLRTNPFVPASRADLHTLGSSSTLMTIIFVFGK